MIAVLSQVLVRLSCCGACHSSWFIPAEFTLQSVQEQGLTNPVVFKEPKGLGLR